MTEHEWIEGLLHGEAESVSVLPQMPAAVRQRIRRRQGLVMGVAAISLAALTVGVTSIPAIDRPITPGDENVARTETVVPLARGTENGVGWDMELRRMTAGSESSEGVCVVSRGQPTCMDITGYAYGEASVALGYVEALDRSVVIVKTVPRVNTVGMREIAGTSWAAMVASEGDTDSGRPAFFYRFFDRDVTGVLTVHGADVPKLMFSVKVRGPDVYTSVGVTRSEIPELSGYPGEKQVVASGPEAGGYSVIMRTTESQVCLHMGQEFRCRAADAPVDPIRLWIAQALPCGADDDCGPGNDLVIITGEVSDEVVKVGIRDGFGTSYVQVGEPFGENIFEAWAYGKPGDQVELVAFDSSENELLSLPIVFSDGG